MTRQIQEQHVKLGMVTHTYNPSIWEAETGGWPRVQGQPELHNETLSQKTKN